MLKIEKSRYLGNGLTDRHEILKISRWRMTAILTRNPAIAEGPRDAGVPVEIW